MLERIDLRGHERIIDAGCGSGRLTAELLERAPFGHVVAVDMSSSMLVEARQCLEPRFGQRVTFVEADLTTLTVTPPADVIFSAATFHWIHDHDRLFASLARCLVPRGRLVSQFGAEGNLARVREHAALILAEPAFASRMDGFSDPFHFPNVKATADRLERSGFINVKTSTALVPTPFEEAGVLYEFLESIVFRAHVAHIDDPKLERELVERVVEKLTKDDPPRTLDYIRLNADGQRPAKTGS